jgi:zinc transporter
MADALIHAVLVRDNQVRILSLEEARDWRPGDGLLWMHFEATDPDTAAWLEGIAALPEVAIAALTAEDTRPRASTLNDALLLNLRGINLNPRADPQDMVSLRFFVDANRVITTRRRPVMAVKTVLDNLANDPVTSSGDLIVRLAGRLVDRVTDEIDEMEERAADVEQAVLSNADRTMRKELSELRRDAIAIRRYLAPQREALNRLQGERLSWLTDMDRLCIREINDRLVRQLEDLDAIRERAAVVQEELLSQLSEQLNQRTYVLSVVAAIFLPLGFLTGLLGINVGGIPGADSPLGFVVFSGILIVIVGVQLWYFIRKGWF